MNREGKTQICYSSVASEGDLGRGGAGGNGAAGYAMVIDPSLEPITRQIMAAMGGTQPTEIEWELLFANPMKNGGSGGSMDGALADRMHAAYRLAQQGFRKPIEPT